MLIVLHPDVTPQAQATIEGRVRELGFTPHPISGAGAPRSGSPGTKGPSIRAIFASFPASRTAFRSPRRTSWCPAR